MLHTEIHTHDLHRAVCTITLHVTATFNLIRGTNLTEFFSCAMFGDGRCVTIHPFLLLSWILLLFASVTSLCIWSFTTVRTCLPTFPLNSQELAESSSTYRIFNVSSPLTESSSKLSLQSLSSCDCINRSSSPVCFPSLTRSVGTQVSRRRFVTECFICTLASHGLCPVPSISSTVSNRSLTYMPCMTQCKRSFGSVT